MSKQRPTSGEGFDPTCWKHLHPAMLRLLRRIAAEVARRWQDSIHERSQAPQKPKAPPGSDFPGGPFTLAGGKHARLHFFSSATRDLVGIRVNS